MINCLNYFVLMYRTEQCSKDLVFTMKTTLIDEMNKMVKQIVENEQEVIKLNTAIKEKRKELEKKKEINS